MTSDTDTSVFVTAIPAFGKSPRSAAERFAESYWTHPRRVLRWDDNGVFRVSGTSATYRVVHIAGTRGVSEDAHEIYQL